MGMAFHGGEPEAGHTNSAGNAERPPGSVSTAPVSRPRILVIDDEEAIRSALSRALAAEGLVTDLAETAADGLSRARAEVYDLVILDLLMPGMDGFAALRQLLRDRPEQTVLVLSCLADVRYKVDCFDLGARDYLTKPFSLAWRVPRVSPPVRVPGSGPAAARRVPGTGPAVHRARRTSVPVTPGPGHRRRPGVRR